MTFSEFMQAYPEATPWLALATLVLAVVADVRQPALRPTTLLGIIGRLALVGVVVSFVPVPATDDFWTILVGAAEMYLVWLFVVTTVHAWFASASEPWY